MTAAMTPSAKTVDIGGQAYTLKFNFGMARLAERELGQSLMSAFRAEGDGQARVSLDAISAIWWASLQANHPMTRDESDELVDGAGFGAVGQWVADGLGDYFSAGSAKAGAPGKARTKRVPKPR